MAVFPEKLMKLYKNKHKYTSNIENKYSGKMRFSWGKAQNLHDGRGEMRKESGIFG